MELKDFITESLVSIVEGISNANKQYDRFIMGGQRHYRYNKDVQEVEFDVAVEIEKAGQLSGNV